MMLSAIRFHRSLLLAVSGAALATALPQGAALAQEEIALDDAMPSEQQAIETGLKPQITFAGEPTPTFTVQERMESMGVSAVSVAVMRGGKMHWARAYGEAPAGTDTLYQAASMSKVVAATGIVALAQERGFSLDADIMPALAGVLDVKAVNPGGVPVTLRGLLSHTNGASVSGFEGYAAGQPIPGTLQVVLGTGGANSDPVVIDPAKVGTFEYSGGGYTLAQLWAETVSGEGFDTLMQRLVLKPVGMELSSFGLAPPARGVAKASEGFDGPVEGGWNTYPESAAAGLWTTPGEYARFGHAMMRAMQGDGSAGIDPAVAAEVLRVVKDDYGLGIAVEDVEGSGQIRLSHSGGNRGYRTQFNAYPGKDEVIVVMTNAPGGWNLLGEVMRAARPVYGWPVAKENVKTRYPMAAAALAQLAGDYVEEGKNEVAVSFTVSGSELKGRTAKGFQFRMVPIGPETFIDPDEGGEIKIRREGDRVTMESYGTIFVRQPVVADAL